MLRSFSASYEATPASIGLLRNRMGDLAADCGLDDRGIGDVKLAVSEAATNALIHGYRERVGTIRVRAVITGGELLINVRDEGTGMGPRTDSPGLGLGLPVMASVARRLEIVRDAPGTEVRMAFGCPACPADELLGSPA